MTSEFGFNCPAGGKWYACGKETTSKFVGCCATEQDPCSQGCNDGSLQPGAFNVSMFGKFPDAGCGAQSSFFSCVGAVNSTFWGCCKTNACQAGAKCTGNNLAGAFLDTPVRFDAYTTSKSSPSPSPMPESKSSNGAIIGGAVGGGVVVALIIGVLIFFLCRRKKRIQQRKHGETGEMVTASTPMMNEKSKHCRDISDPYANGMQSPPPMYASPNPAVYQDSFDPKSASTTQPYQTHGHDPDGPSELPAEYSMTTANNTYAELPAEASSSRDPQRTSELPANATAIAAELESPQVTPRPVQSEFSTDLAKRPRERL